ncbi:molybdenum cofactor biosynthesis protein B [Ferrimonas senticii]|uniref:molybdenum cofactor biosynthesis protein B n=1 Tax=Ferrimonas senticii TaxID=394566 RepID=UPI000406A519|nr:molybdenum cofactor biosynthesis protein B [Ferrimonas senticii]
MQHLCAKAFVPLNVAVLTMSDTRDWDSDKSGQFLVDSLQEAGHNVVERQIIKDDKYQIRAVISEWIASDHVQVIITTGGTGFTERDSTPESVQVLFDKEIEGFGELFRQITFAELGTSTIQSRAIGGFANKVAIFCLPGSTGACRTGWSKILKQQLDASHRPCNFVPHLKVITQ